MMNANKILAVGLLACGLAGSALAETSTSSSDSNNLAVAWCEKKGGKVFQIKSATVNNVNSAKNNKCLLPTGELVDIWTLYKRDRK